MRYGNPDESHQPIRITGKRGNAALIGEDDRRSVQETLYLTSTRGMRESTLKGMATPADDLADRLDW